MVSSILASASAGELDTGEEAAEVLTGFPTGEEEKATQFPVEMTQNSSDYSQLVEVMQPGVVGVAILGAGAPSYGE